MFQLLKILFMIYYDLYRNKKTMIYLAIKILFTKNHF